MKNKKNLTKSAFTLIELLVVISIIGVLATLVVSNLNEARARARDSRKKQGLDQLRTALQLYYNDVGIYPADANGRYIKLCSVDGRSEGTSNCQTGNLFSYNGTVYMSSLPEYQYDQITNDTFILKLDLENASDPDIALTQTRCTGTWGSTTYVVCP